MEHLERSSFLEVPCNLKSVHPWAIIADKR
jgi:hypothetical protein